MYGYDTQAGLEFPQYCPAQRFEICSPLVDVLHKGKSKHWLPFTSFTYVLAKGRVRIWKKKYFHIIFKEPDKPQLSAAGTHDDRRDLHIVFCENKQNDFYCSKMCCLS